VWSGREEEPIVEARRELAHGARHLAVDRVAASRGRRRDVRFIEHEQALACAGAEVPQEGLSVLGSPEELVRDDEAIVGLPHRHAEAALLPALGDELTRHHLEVQAEAAAHLVAPLEADRCGTADQDEVRLLPQDELLHHEARFDGLSETDVVGDEEVRSRELEGLHQRRELMGHVLDARAKGCLEARGVRRAHRVPSQRVEVGAEVSRGIEARRRAGRPSSRDRPPRRPARDPRARRARDQDRRHRGRRGGRGPTRRPGQERRPRPTTGDDVPGRPAPLWGDRPGDGRGAAARSASGRSLLRA
jgi:hypothetical protein